MSPDPNQPLRTLDREAAPPPGLKGSVISSLYARGLLRHSRQRAWRVPLSIAAALALFAMGWMVGHRPATLDPRPAFALVLYEGSDFQRDQSEAESIAEYGAWAAALRSRGTVVSGEALDRAVGLLRSTPTGIVIDPRDASSDEGVMTGFFIIHAANQAEALEIARTCPHLRHGGRIALRPVIPTS